MAKLTKTTAFKVQVPKQETPMDKTSRIVRTMVDEESEKRQVKNTRLRNARLEREASTPTESIKGARKKGSPKAATK